jgi:radical SAM protein with 4Fe4S-binding SPASM domain
MGTWIIKLDNRMRADLALRTVVAVRDHHELGVRLRGNEQTTVVLDGGEPLALPIAYLDEVMATWSRVMADRAGVQLTVQTNLSLLTDAHVAFLKRHALDVRVACGRLRVSGREADAGVLRNMDRLRDDGIAYSAVCALTRHTAPRLREIYAYFAERRVPLRILPLLGSSDAPPPSHDESQAALQDLFVYWIESGRPIAVAPLDRYLEVAVRKLCAMRDGMYSRRDHGEQILVVSPEGRLYRNDDLGEPVACIGDLSTQTYAEILTSDRRALSLEYDEEREGRICGRCEFWGACSGLPLLESKRDALHAGRCAVAYAMHAFVERYLALRKLAAGDLKKMIHAA